jgi:Tol biopolymer transport system component
MPLPVGTRIGPYEVSAAIGAGGMGEVYRARDERLNRDVALKVLPASFASDADRLRRFTLEAQSAGGLNHPNVLTIYEIGRHEGQPFLAAELLTGETLRAKLSAGPIPVSKAVDYARQTCAGLAAAHARQIVHRDIKPENLFVTTDGRVKILDFGLARQAGNLVDAGDDTRMHTGTSPGVVLGTVGYMSPEQVRGQPIDHRSDLFSLGIVLYEMLSGTRPFVRDSAVETMNAILTEDPPEPTASGRAVPPALAQVLRHALEKQPDERFQSARDLAFALQAASGTASGSTATPALAGAGQPRSRGMAALAIAALVGTTAGALAVWLLQPRPETRDLGTRRFTPIATDATVEIGPTWSPDGRSVAYFSRVGSTASVLIRDLDAAAPVTLVRSLRDPDESLFWWPDGSRVGYTTVNGVWSVSRGGGEPERLQAGLFGTVALSPDGRTLAMWKTTADSSRRTSALWIASPPDAAPVKYDKGFVDNGSFRPNFLGFSPDGSRLLLSGYLADPANPRDFPPAVWEIVGSSLDTMGAPRRVFAPGAWSSPPAFSWLPDSRRAILAMGPEPGLWLGDVARGALSKITDGLAGEREPSVSGDGRVAFELGRDDYDLIEIPLDGSAIIDVLSASPNESGGSRTPSGQVVYVSNQSGVDEIRVRSADGFDRAIVSIRDLAGGRVGRLQGPVTSPDGQRVLFNQLVDDVASSWTAPMSGGAPVRVVPGDAMSWMPVWSPDGRWIAYATETGGVSRVEKRRVGSSEGAQIVADKLATLYGSMLEWSPDGAWIAHDSPEGLSLAAAEGGTRRVLTPKVRPRAIAWSADARTIYGLIVDDEGQRIISIDVASGTSRVVRPVAEDLLFRTPINPGLRLSLSADGKRLLTTVMRSRSDIWMMDGGI